MKRRKKRPEPFYRNFDGWWYVQIGKQQIKLIKGPKKETEDAAWRAYYRIMAEQGHAIPAAPLRDPTVTAVCNLFLDYSLKANAQRTYGWKRPSPSTSRPSPSRRTTPSPTSTSATP